jgi:hypothetical protein
MPEDIPLPVGESLKTGSVSFAEGAWKSTHPISRLHALSVADYPRGEATCLHDDGRQKARKNAASDRSGRRRASKTPVAILMAKNYH